MASEFPTVVEFGLEATAELLTLAFADYLVPIVFSPVGILTMVRVDSVDLTLSRVLVVDGSPAGAALVARRGWTSRLAGMALLPGFRRQGYGRALVARVLDDALDRGDKAMVLEVIEQNKPAVRLYEQCGFHPVRRLLGFFLARREARNPSRPPLEEIDAREFAHMTMVGGLPDLPWQLAGETLVQLGPPFSAWCYDGAAAFLSDVVAPTIVLRGLLPGPANPDKSVELLLSLLARFPAREWVAKPVFPEEYGGIFLQAGFGPTRLTQWQMRITASGIAASRGLRWCQAGFGGRRGEAGIVPLIPNL